MVESEQAPGAQAPAPSMLDRSEFAAAIGRRLADVRRRRSLTQAQLAQMLGVTEKSVRQWELGNHVPNAVDLGQIGLVLRCSVDWLVGRPWPVGDDTVYLVNARTEALLLGATEVTKQAREYYSRLGIMADSAAESCSSIEEWARRMERVRQHFNKLMEKGSGDAGKGDGDLEGLR